MEIKEELNKAFKDYSYHDPTHTYTHIPTGKKIKSVTQFLSGLKDAFNVEFWSTLKAFEYSGYNILSKKDKENYFIIDGGEMINPGFTDIRNYEFKEDCTPEDIRARWKVEKHTGINRGSYLHKLLEDLELGNKETNVYDFIDEITQKRIDWESQLSNHPWDGEYISTKETFTLLHNLGIQFLQENSNYLTPMAIESLVGDFSIGLAGTFDRMYFNERTQEFEIWDFKTDKKIDYKNKYQKIKLFDLEDCEFEKYSLQTSLYKYIIQKNTPIVLGKSRIVHFNLKDNKYEIITTNDYTNLINEKINEHHWSTYI